MLVQSPSQKILFINEAEHVGGGQVYINSLVAELESMGHSVTLVVGKKVFWKVHDLIKEKKFDQIVWGVYNNFPILTFGCLSLLAKQKKIHTSLIIFSVWYYFFTREVAYWKHKQFVLEEELRRHWYIAKYWLKQLIFIFFSNTTLHLSEYARSLYSQAPLFDTLPKKHVIISGGVDRSAFKEVSTKVKKKIRQSLGVGDKEKVLLIAGRTEFRKNYVDALRVLSELLKVDRSYRLYFVISSTESSNDLQYLQLLFEKVATLGLGSRVHFITGIGHAEIQRFYQMANGFLMLSKQHETFGLVSLESLASGCPVFGYRACVLPEILGKSGRPFLATSGEYRALARKVHHFFSQPIQKQRQLIQAVRKNVDRYSWSQGARAISTLKVLQ